MAMHSNETWDHPSRSDPPDVAVSHNIVNVHFVLVGEQSVLLDILSLRVLIMHTL